MILYNSLSKIPPLESILSSSDRALKLCHSSFRVHSEGKAEKLLFPKGKCKCTNSPFIWTAITFVVSHKRANWVKCWILILELPFHFPFQKISNTLFFFPLKTLIFYFLFKCNLMIKPGWFQSLSLNCSWYAVRHKASGNIIFNIQKGLSAIQIHLSGHRSNRSHCSLWSSGTCQTIIARVPHSSRERHQEQKQQAQRISLNLLHLKGLEVAKVFSTKEIYFGVIQYENRKKNLKKHSMPL